VWLDSKQTIYLSSAICKRLTLPDIVRGVYRTSCYWCGNDICYSSAYYPTLQPRPIITSKMHLCIRWMSRTIKTWSCTKNAYCYQKQIRVAIGKRVETETASVSVPVEKRVVIERVTPTDAAGSCSWWSCIRWRRSCPCKYTKNRLTFKEAFVRKSKLARSRAGHGWSTRNDSSRRVMLIPGSWSCGSWL